MIGGDIGSVKDMLAKAFTRASEAKDKAAQKPEAKAAAEQLSAPPKGKDGPAFLLSANLEDLTGRLKDMSKGASGNAKAGVAQAEEGLAKLEGILEYSEEFAKQLDGVMRAFERDLGRMLQGLGVDEKEIEEALGGFRDRFGEDARREAVDRFNENNPPQTVAAASSERSATSLSVEVRSIEMTIQHGDKSLTIKYDSASLSLNHASERVSVATDGRGLVAGAESSALSLNASSRGLSIEAEGFSAEELKGIAEGLNGLFAEKNPEKALQSLVTVKPLAAGEGTGKGTLSVDLAGFLDDAFGFKGANGAVDTRPREGLSVLV